MLAPISWRTPPRHYGPWEQVTSLLTEALVARGVVKGTLNIYRVGEEAAFTEEEFLLAKRFGDAAALAIDNAHIRARLEQRISSMYALARARRLGFGALHPQPEACRGRPPALAQSL